MNRFAFSLFWFLFLVLISAGCQDSAVVFAPTAPPPDLSPMLYQHPSGAFRINVPRTWAVYVQNSATLASASFTPPEETTPALKVAVIRLEAAGDLLALVNQYQEAVRPDAAHIIEQERQAMGDGSWRLLGLRTLPGAEAVPLNTFLQKSGDLLAVTETVLSDDPTRLDELEQAVNTLTLDDDNTLTAAPLSALSHDSPADIRVSQVTAWTTALGVYFVTGEVVNTSDHPIGGIPIRVALLRADGSEAVDAVDTVMGYTLAPGDYAPFSLRFGAGRPPDATQYRIDIGAAGWSPSATTPDNIVSGEALSWTQESSISPEGHLLIEGTVTNNSRQTLYHPVAVMTVFDATQGVIAAAFTPTLSDQLAPGESTMYYFRVQEMGGAPAHTIITVQARADAD